MAIVQSQYRENSSPLPKVEIVGILQPTSGSSGSPSLELRVNIEGRDHNVLLPLDALASYGIEGPAVAMELRAIRKQVLDIAQSMAVSGEVVVGVLEGIEALYRLPKRGTE